LEVAHNSNIALKWSMAPSLFSEEGYPLRATLPLLRRAIDAFGVDRMVWASGYTVGHEQTW
jgi:predicted TIM-barrel fold metal-dependent hydrolase